MSEAKLSQDICKFLRAIGFAVWSTEQGYRKEAGGTRQTPGIADLIIMGHGIFLFAELKWGKNKLRPAQEVFRDECRRADVEWVEWRSTDDAWDWCVENGFITEAT